MRHYQSKNTNQEQTQLSTTQKPNATVESTSQASIQRVVGNQLLQRQLGVAKNTPSESFSDFQARLGFSVQAKLTVTPAGDKYEQEADAVADQVVQAMRIQRQDDEDMMLQRQEDDDLMMQRQADFSGGGAVTDDVESQIQAARGSGQTLSDSVRGPMESSFGTDFSSVRVHTDSQSDSLNRSVQARAFTTGSDIFFRSGEYNPQSEGGKKLLAHELTHVVQQGGAKQIQQKKDE